MNILKNINKNQFIQQTHRYKNYLNKKNNPSIKYKNINLQEKFCNILNNAIKKQDVHTPTIPSKVSTSPFNNVNIEKNKYNIYNHFYKSLNNIEHKDISAIYLLIGHNILIPGSQIQYVKNNETIYGYYLSENALSVVIEMKDLNDKIVFSKTIVPQESGNYMYSWDGKMNNNQLAESGTYKISIQQNNGFGPCKIQPLIHGVVQNVTQVENTKEIKINLGVLGQVNVEDIRKIF